MSDQDATPDKQHSHDSLTSAVLAWANARDDSELRTLIEARWGDLSTNAADHLLGELLQQYAPNPAVVAQLRSRRHLLHQCRTVGIHFAFAQHGRPTFDDKVLEPVCRFLESGSDEVRRVFMEYRETLLSDEAQRVFAHMERYYQDDDNLRNRVRERRGCIRVAIDGGIERAFPIFVNRDAINDALEKLLAATDWPATMEIIRTHSAVLLSDEANRYIESLLTVNPDPAHPIYQALAFHRGILARARQDGLDSILIDAGRPRASADAPLSDAERMEMDELLSLISARWGVCTPIRVEDIESLLSERPDLRKAWERLGPWTIDIDANDANRAELRRIVEQLDRLDGPNNVEQRVRLMRRALEVPFVHQAGAVRAAIHADLASALLSCPGRDRAALLEEALIHAELAETVWTKETNPVQWAQNRWSMGNILTHRMVGGSRSNIERALACFEVASEILDAERPTRSRVIEYISLGNAYCLRVAGSMRDNIEDAIRYLKRAFDDETFPLLDARAQGDAWSIYGNAMTVRLAGEPADNIEEGVHALYRAQALFRNAEIPERLGLANHCLARALTLRHYGDPAENLSEAIKLLDSYAQLCAKEQWPERWAIAMMSHASLIARRARTREEIDLALEGFKAAQTYFTRVTSPHHWAEIEQGRGSVLLEWAEMSGRTDDLDEAQRHLRAALEIFDRDSSGLRWSRLHLKLGRLHALLGRRGSMDAVAKAEAHYRLCLEELTPDSFPVEHSESQAALGRLLLASDRWAEAHEALSHGIQAGVLAFEIAYTEVGRHAAIARISLLFAEEAYALVRLQRYGEAVVRLDAGKARILAQSLASNGADLAGVDAVYRAELQCVRRRVQEIEATMRSAELTPGRSIDREMAAALREARSELAQQLGKVRGAHPELMYGALTLNALLALPPPGGALIAPIVSTRGTAILVIPHQTREVTENHVVHVDSFTRTNLRELLHGDKGDGELEGWLGAYIRQKSCQPAWLDAIDRLGNELWTLFMGPVHAALERLGVRKGAPVILMPQGGLALLPLHAAWRDVDGTKRYLADDYIVSFAPSGYALDVSQKRVEHALAAQSLLAVINPTGDLKHAQAEGEALEALLGDACVPLYQSDATVERVREAAPHHTHLHFCCHGTYHWHTPMKSGLLLAGEQMLTLADVLGTLDLTHTRLVTLSACETGITDIRRMPDEHIGLPSSFLNAGAAAVISTLWPVHDFATMLLMKRFYHLHFSECEPPAAALSKAQQWLRGATNEDVAEYLQRLQPTDPDTAHSSYRSAAEHFAENASLERARKPFEHPYCWAAFVLNGA